MASVQQLETQVEVLKGMVGFLMTNLRMAGFKPNGLVRADGMPDGEVLQGTALDFYRMAMAENLEIVNRPVLAPNPPTEATEASANNATD